MDSQDDTPNGKQEAWLQEERSRFHATYRAAHPVVLPGQPASDGITEAVTVHHQQPVYFRRELPPHSGMTNEEWSKFRRRSLALVLRQVAAWVEEDRAFDVAQMWLRSDENEIGVGLLVDR